MNIYFLACIACFCGLAADPPQEKAKATYESLLRQMKKGDPKVDFQKARMAFSETDAYNPYDLNSKSRELMNKALKDKDYAKAAEVAEQLLKTNYVDIPAHSVGYRAYTELKKDEEAKLHRFVHDGLIQSILKSGDGKTPATAYVVISTDEEYAVLGALGIRRTRQGVMEDQGQHFDMLQGVDRQSNQSVALYFNITKQMNRLFEQFKKGK